MAKVNYIPQNWFDTNVPDTQSGYIIPGKLHPAYLGKLLDDSTSHSGSYGSIQSDGRKYYYTDIDGSRPIKDPRIGAHFGSQRHKFTSLQLLEQETATHGHNVYTVDGREWCRATGPNPKTDHDQGAGAFNSIQFNPSTVNDFIEVVGYFNNVNVSVLNLSNSANDVNIYIDGTDTGNDFSTRTTNNGPFFNSSRYVDSGSFVNINVGSLTTPGIHTLKIGATTTYYYIFGIELIAQDTTSAATRSQIQIPEQDVFTHGKKVRIPAHTEHYDPFNGFTSGSDISSYVDTTTSLGLSKWLHSGNYYRPYNGMRVVKWAGRSGIHTSVTVMPPNAKSIADSSSLTNGTAKANASVANDNFRPTFEAHTTSLNEDRLHEVAKMFHFREFGNGAANGGTGATHADASMLTTTADDIAYVMDDGLTSMSGHGVKIQNLSTFGGVRIDSNSKSIYFTFIGTGIQTIRQRDNSTTEEPVTWAQNLPYGTHILELQRDGSADQVVKIDGITLETNSTTDKYLIHGSPTFYQPKMPPIPDDACIIADYMLMADFVPATSIDGSISKGVRYCNAGRDIFYDSGGTITYNGGYQYLGYQITSLYNNNATSEARFTAFGTAYACHYVRGTNREANLQARLDGANYTYVEGDVFDTSGEWDDSNDDGTLTKDGGSEAFHLFGIKNQTLGIHTFGDKKSSGTDYNAWSAFDVATPIHTSHHYKTFETPFLYELIGGDRNMEQTHLVCSPDGRTWDEVTRDKSYLGPKYSLTCSAPNGGSSSGATSSTGSSGKLNSFFTDYRGNIDHVDMHNKGIALAYDSFIPLHDGFYEISLSFRGLNGTQLGIRVSVNDNDVKDHFALGNNNDHGGINFSDTYYMKRGERWDVAILSGTFRIQYRISNLLQVKYLGSDRYR